MYFFESRIIKEFGYLNFNLELNYLTLLLNRVRDITRSTSTP